MKSKIQLAIERLGFAGEGAGYSKKGHRNPIRDDTQNILTALAASHRPQTILELGTAHGLSALCFLRGYSDGHIITVEFDSETAENAQVLFNGLSEGNVSVLAQSSTEAIQERITQQFDMVFFDHEKGLYLKDLRNLEIKGLLKENCVIIADNVTDRLKECKPFIDYIGENFQHSIVPTECGLLVAQWTKARVENTPELALANQQ